MKRIITLPSKWLLILYRVLLVLIITLVFVLAAGSLLAISLPPDSKPLFRIGNDRKQKAPNIDLPVNVFSGIGRLRIPTVGDPPYTVILSVSFPYPADDRVFTEELASRIGDFRSVATEYFASLPPEKISSLDEAAAKKEILTRYNALLRLGRIETLYFGDLMVIE